MQRLAERVSIITGGASGIGAAMARKLASECAIIVIADLDIARARDVPASIEGDMPVTGQLITVDGFVFD